jgi:hypothetical protein
MNEFQPPDQEEEPEDDKWERYFAEKEKNGYVVLSRDEWNARIDEACRDAYAAGRDDQRREDMQEFAAILPGAYYMDPPDGGNVSVLEQFRRMAADAEEWRGRTG